MSTVVPFPGQVDRDALALNFFDKVLPSHGLYCSAVKKRTGGFHHTFHESFDSLWTTLRDADHDGHTTYFALASFSSNASREAVNVAELQCLWLDIDFGPGHSTPCYATFEEARDALKTFYMTVGLPTPMVVKSGGGFHAYWPMREALPRVQWQRHAEGLKAACIKHGLRSEHSMTANAAAILRPPGTLNRKLATARWVEFDADWLQLGPYDWPEELLSYTSTMRRNVVTFIPTRPSHLGAYEPAKQFADPYPTISAASLISECGQYARFAAGERVAYPLWLLLGAGAPFIKDGGRQFHEWSQLDPRYKYDETQKIIEGASKLTGPPRCDSIKKCGDAKALSICSACPKEGTIVTPLSLGANGASHESQDQFNGAPSLTQLKKAPYVEWDKTEKGGLRASFKNTALAISKLNIVCKYDTFHLKKYVEGEGVGPMLDDSAGRAIREQIISRWRFDPGKLHVQEALERECDRNPFNPVVDYLKRLKWDGWQRLDAWLADYLGAEDNLLNRAFGRKTLIAAVRRVFNRGCKFDHLLVIEGPQGAGKSSAWRILAGEENFSDQAIKWDDPRQQREASGGVWIHEIAELVGLRKADVEAIKSFLSRQNDRTRAAYDRYSSDQFRQGIFVGTVNPVGRHAEYLTDPSGARRFWPVRIGRIDLEEIRRDRDQLWAEAVHYEQQNESLDIGPELYQVATDQQDLRRISDPWADLLSAVKGVAVSSIDLMVRDLGLERGRITPQDAARMGVAMRRLGWDGPKQIQIDGQWVKGFTR